MGLMPVANAIVPNAFQPCCNVHDTCYGKAGANRTDCDNAMKSCLYSEAAWYQKPIAWAMPTGGHRVMLCDWLTVTDWLFLLPAERLKVCRMPSSRQWQAVLPFLAGLLPLT